MSDEPKIVHIPWTPHFRPMAPPRQHTIDPRTGIFPISEWGPECGRGFVSNARFSPTDTVIKRTDRSVSRKWRELEKTP